MEDYEQEEREDLARLGVTVPTGVMVKGARWAYQYGARDQLIDLLARDWLAGSETDPNQAGKLHLVPSDTSIVSGDLAARMCRQIARTAVQRAIRLADGWEQYADALTAAHKAVLPMCDRPTLVETLALPTPAQVIHASINPMGYSSWSLAREHAGSKLLGNAGLPSTRPDVSLKGKRVHVARRDPVAYRGAPRFALRAPCRYGRNGLQPGYEYVMGRTIWQADLAGSITPAVDSWSHAELLTALTRVTSRRYPSVIEHRDSDGKLVGRRTEYGTVRLPDDGTRRGWRGHRAVTWQAASRTSKARKAARSAARAARAATSATGRRGPAVGPWSLKTASLPRAIKARDLAATVALIESVIRLADDRQVISFPNGTVVAVSGPAEVVTLTGKAYAVREFARRAALAGYIT